MDKGNHEQMEATQIKNDCALDDNVKKGSSKHPEPAIKSNARVAAELAGGTVGGILQVLVGHPLDTIKVRMQSSNYYRSLLHCLSETLCKEGASAFYKGVGPPLVMAGVLNGVMFGTNGTMKRLVGYVCDEEPRNLSLLQVTAAALLTAPVYCAFVSPVELVKCRLQIQRDGHSLKYTGPVDVLRQTISQNGFQGLFAGYRVTVLTRLIGSPCYFVAYDVCKRKMLERSGSSSPSQMQALIAGGIAGAVFWTANYPVDALRTRIQVTDGPTPPIIRTVVHTIRTEGVSSLYRGYSACLLRSFPANAAVFYGLEMTLRVLGYSNF
eukprot:gene2699-8115_t